MGVTAKSMSQNTTNYIAKSWRALRYQKGRGVGYRKEILGYRDAGERLCDPQRRGLSRRNTLTDRNGNLGSSKENPNDSGNHERVNKCEKA